MLFFRIWVAALALLAISCSKKPSEEAQALLDKGTGVITLPAGTIELTGELRLPPNAHDIEIVGQPSTVLRAAREFQGRSMLSIGDAKNVTIRGLHFDGNRTENDRRMDLPPAGMPFSNHFGGSGIVITNSANVKIHDCRFREMLGFAIAGAGVKKIRIEKVSIEDSGSRNNDNRNNTTGGILLEEGTDDFEVLECDLKKVLGLGIWTHANAGSPRNYRGLISRNTFEGLARGAIQVGGANKIRVENNKGKYIGHPASDVDGKSPLPAALSTTGKVDESIFIKNSFEDLNGKCFDLDGFHDSEVAENTCVSRGKPEDYPNGHFALTLNNSNAEMESQLVTIRDNVFDGTKFGGMFIIGHDHKITGNKLLNINKSRCNEGTEKYKCAVTQSEPNLLQAGIFLAARAERAAPAEGVIIENNEIRGHKMASRCILTSVVVLAPKQKVGKNLCVDEDPK